MNEHVFNYKKFAFRSRGEFFSASQSSCFCYYLSISKMPAKKRSTSKAASKSAAKKVNRNVELKKIFDEIDSDGSGAIDETELLNNAGLLGFGKLTQFEIGKLLDEADTDGDGEMDFAEFVAVVEKARYNDSKWKNAGALANGVKRYNNLLSASDAMFGNLQTLVAASCETDESGKRIAGCSRLLAVIASSTLVFFATVLFIFVVGWSTVQKGFDLVLQMDACKVSQDANICITGVQAKAVLLAMGMVVPVAIYFSALFILQIVGLTRSQAHIGHILFGFQVISTKTGKPVGTCGTFGRILMPGMLQNGLIFLAPQYVFQILAIMCFITYIVNPIMLAAHPKSQHVWDLMLSQNVVIKEN